MEMKEVSMMVREMGVVMKGFGMVMKEVSMIVRKMGIKMKEIVMARKEANMMMRGMGVVMKESIIVMDVCCQSHSVTLFINWEIWVFDHLCLIVILEIIRIYIFQC